ncbi:MAG: DUF5615 family PIN-like protein [Fimbriimonadaceae bacterium]
MKIKLDENIPSDLSLPGDVDTVEQEGLAGCDDDTVWAAAQDEGRFFITQDLDFSDLRKFELGSHAGILLLRLSNPSRANLAARLSQLLSSEYFHEQWAGCFVVATDSKVRVRALFIAIADGKD